MRTRVMYGALVIFGGALSASPGTTLKNTAKAVVNTYLDVEARTMAPIRTSRFAQPFEDVSAVSQLEFIDEMAKQLADFVGAYPPAQLFEELKKIATLHDYVFAVLVGAILIYSVYGRVMRPSSTL